MLLLLVIKIDIEISDICYQIYPEQPFFVFLQKTVACGVEGEKLHFGIAKETKLGLLTTF